METSATILHADLDAFYASVEQLLDPSLRGKPIAVGGGVVLAASYEAKAFGISGGMSGRRARELCPQLIFVGGHFKEYQRLGDAAINVLNDFTPLVERISIDEAFADGAAGQNRCPYHWAAGGDARMVSPTGGWSRGRGKAHSTGVESRSTGNQDAPASAIGWSAVSARQEAC
jgi:nucleotidyltransferase/DNA polymerase involved in DNA repair